MLGNGVTVTNAITIDAAGASVMVGGNDAATINSSLSGGTLTKTGAGTLSVTNAVSGNFIVEGGTLNFSSYLYQNVAGIDLRADAKLILQQNWTSLDKASGATALPRIDMAGGAVIELHNGGTNTRVNADIVVNATDKAAVIRGIDQGSDNMELKGTVSGAGTLQLRSLADDGVRNTNIWKVNSAISDGAKAALGLEIKDVTLTIGGSSASTFSGGTSISNSSVTVNKASAFGSGKLELTNSTVALGSDLEVGAISGASGLVTGSHDISLTGAKGTATYSGAISGISLAKSGVGVQEFTNVGSLTGVSVTGGGLSLTGSAMELQNVSVGGAGTLTLGGNVSLSSAISSSGTVVFNGASFTLAAADFTNNRYDIVTGSGTTSGSLSYTVTGDTTGTFRLGGMGSGHVYILSGTGELTWDGTTATGGDAWGESNWLLDGTEASFASGDTVHFTADAQNKAVTVAAAGVTAGTMDITGTGYTFSGGDISATSLTLGSGVTATFQTGLTVGSDITLNGGTLKFKTDGVYNVGMNMSGTGNVEISGSGAKTIGGKLTNVTLTMNGEDTLGFTRQLAMEGGKLVINSGTVTLDNHDGGTAQLKNTEIEVYGGGTLTIQHDTMGWSDNSCVRSILLQGSSATELAILNNNDTDTSDGNFGNTSRVALSLAGHTRVKDTGTHGIRVWNGMSITATSTDNTISSNLNVDNSISITVGDATHPGSELLISGIMANGSPVSKAVTKQGDGTLTLTGDNTADGDLNINAGVVAIGASGVNTGKWSGAISVASGAQLILNKSDAMASGKTLTIDGTGTDSNGALVFANGVTLGNAVSVAAGGASVMTGNGVTATLSGALSGSGTLSKVGAGTLRLNGTNTYTGTTTVKEGTLALADGSLYNGHMTISHNGTGDGTIQSAKIDGATISGLEGTQGQVGNLKVLYADSKVTFSDMVISADSHIGKEPVVRTYGLVESTADGAVPTEAAMSGSKLKLETGTGKNATLRTATATEVITRNDGKPDIAIGTTLSYVDCTTFNVDVLSGTLTLDFSSIWSDILAQHTQYIAVDFNNVEGFAEGTVISACIGNADAAPAIAYGSTGGHIVYFEVSQIPEPATATLSLLALAALAARRRRKG